MKHHLRLTGLGINLAGYFKILQGNGFIVSRTDTRWQRVRSTLKGSATGELGVVVVCTGVSEQDAYKVSPLWFLLHQARWSGRDNSVHHCPEGMAVQKAEPLADCKSEHFRL